MRRIINKIARRLGYVRFEMSDNEIVELLEKTRAVLLSEVGARPCDEMNVGCFNCKTQLAVGILNEWIDTINWGKEKCK